MAEVGIYSEESSLKFAKQAFTLLGKPFKILSAAVHYFRTFPQCWEDRLQKAKACGFNTIETYVPWNLHEENPGEFNFEGILDMRKFIELAHSLDLFVIFRPGPYICSEWDYGGLPAWLLSDPNMQVRSNYQGYKDAVERYFNKLLPMVTDLQHSKGGPIIAVQVENEFGSYSSKIEHLTFIRNLYIKHGLKEMFITSDNAWGQKDAVFYQYALPTANFKEISEGEQLFEQIRKWSPEFPLMVTEFWTGWFDHWTSQHNPTSIEKYEESLTWILKANSSVNMYMFHGGTNFGFMNGANNFDTYKPDVSSYDYDALLTEAGDITPKYLKTRELFLKHVLEPQGITTLPDIPANSPKRTYGSVSVEATVTFETLIQYSSSLNASEPVAMEMLKLNGDYGQNFGYVLYRCVIPGNASKITLTNQPMDRAQIFVDGVEKAVIDWTSTSENLTVALSPAGDQATSKLDILVENHGRVNYATEASGILNNQRKGLTGPVTCDGKAIESFRIVPLEFKSGSVNRSDWAINLKNAKVPGLFQAKLQVSGEPADTFVFMKGWGKGILFVNGFNLGRYWSAGPQQTLYLPAQVLKQGTNELVAFEQAKIGQEIMFLDKPILDVNDQSTIQLQSAL